MIVKTLFDLLFFRWECIGGHLSVLDVKGGAIMCLSHKSAGLPGCRMSGDLGPGG